MQIDINQLIQCLFTSVIYFPIHLSDFHTHTHTSKDIKQASEPDSDMTQVLELQGIQNNQMVRTVMEKE